MFQIILTATAENQFSEIKGWELNPAYNFLANMKFECDDFKLAQAKADTLRVQFWKVNSLGGDNRVKKYTLSIYDADNNCKMLQEFSGKGYALKISSH